MTEAELRQAVVSVMLGWLGYSEENGKYKWIIDLYNTQRPQPRGYRVQYDDEWCATTITAAGMAAGLHDIILGECSCSEMIKLYQRIGRWMENDAYVPSPGDIIMYDWSDNGKGDNVGSPDHVGIVEKVVGNTITIIEGNKGEAVARRTLAVNGRYIRGYCLPDYASKAEEENDMLTQEQFSQMMDVWLSENRNKPVSNWAAQAWAKGMAAGVVDGSAPQNPATREQVMMILDRLNLIK